MESGNNQNLPKASLYFLKIKQLSKERSVPKMEIL